MKKILIEISAGELIDKMTILEIKLEKINNPSSKKEVQRELDILKKSALDLQKNEDLKQQYQKLKSVNIKLWDIENKKRLCEKESNFKEEFIQLSRDVHFLNDERAKIKLHINNSVGSNIKEIKEYTNY
jgi:hypothetical protein